jgi:hypothetical protein
MILKQSLRGKQKETKKPKILKDNNYGRRIKEKT